MRIVNHPSLTEGACPARDEGNWLTRPSPVSQQDWIIWVMAPKDDAPVLGSAVQF